MVSCPAALLHAPHPASLDLDRVLADRFGLASFHGWQREAIDALLGGPGQVLLVAPTGGGKSLCYQLPAVVLEGTTVPPRSLVAGVPAKVRRELTDEEVAGVRFNAAGYVLLAETYSR